jgi:hypothetical protein
MPNRILNAAIAGPAVLASLTLLMLLPAQADGVRSTTCVGGLGSVSCGPRKRPPKSRSATGAGAHAATRWYRPTRSASAATPMLPVAASTAGSTDAPTFCFLLLVLSTSAEPIASVDPEIAAGLPRALRRGREFRSAARGSRTNV